MQTVRRICVLLAAALCALPQTRVTAEQVVSFVQDSIRRKQDDGAVAKQVQMLKLSTRLDSAAVTSLQRAGAGAKTVAALTKLSADSANLPAAAPAAPKTEAAEPPPPAPEEWQKILDSVRQAALAYTESLPNFLCSQVTERKVKDGANGWMKDDTILERLSYNDHQESYRVVMINDRVVTDKKHDDLGGTTSSGEFATTLRTIFDPRSGTEFAWSKLVRLARPKSGDRVAYRISFRINEHLYRIEDKKSGRAVSVGYHGFLWADRETSSILRITFDCDNIPADFPIRSISLSLEYEFVEIAGQQFALPIQYDIRSRDDRYEFWNEARYANYQKFGTDSSISFDAPATISPDKLGEKPVVKKQ